VESFHGRLRDECLNTNWFWNLFDARRKIAAWQHAYNSIRPHSARHTERRTSSHSSGRLFRFQQQKIGLDQPHQGDPDGLRFAPALTRLIHDPNNAFQENETEKCRL
jgi:putative transposase